MKKLNVVQMLERDVKQYGVEHMCRMTGLCRGFINKKRGGVLKYKNIDALYDYYRLERDEFYMENLRKSKLKNSKSILGDFFFIKRVQKTLKIQEVAKILKGTTRQLKRIESGESLPGINSYYIQQLLDIYDVTEEERQKVMWFIVIMKDMIEVTSKNKNVLQKPKTRAKLGDNNLNHHLGQNNKRKHEALKQSKSPNQTTLFE